ncbi:MAG: helix-turn-helix domain-containing protein [Proteobacteria bacterium]|nr:helix-turn-helix domain-containing protein [Pseudomonadota bacterium]MBU1594320.1 helix-turn-helix domain-containing protein [Pseudomonadota bacterium]
MNLLEVGALLKRERERRGISIRDVMDATKISRRNLAAIEEGQVSSLPHPVYLKGYVRNIAWMVGLDADELGQVVDLQYDVEQAKYLPQVGPSATAEFSTSTGDSAMPGSRPEQPAQHLPHHASAPERETASQALPNRFALSKPRQSGSWRSVLVLALLVAALVGLLVQFQRPQSVTPPPPVPAAQPALDAANATVQENATSAMSPDDAATEATPSASDGPGAPGGPSVHEAARASAPAAALGVSGGASNAPASSLEASRKEPVVEVRTPGMHLLTITAKEDEVCWVEVNDGQQSRSFTLRNGEIKQVEYSSRMRVRLGNAGGVTFRVDGKDHPYEGRRGNIDTVEFGAR